MSFKEVFFYRTAQAISTKVIQRLHFLSKKRYASLRLRDGFELHNYRLEDLEALFKMAPWTSQYTYFQTEVDLNNTIDWRKDYKNNISSPLNYSGTIKKQDKKNNGDVKYVSELSRFHFLPFLALRAASSKNDEDLEAIHSILNKWTNDNPFLGSINYTSGIEVGIRSLNLIYTHIVLRCFGLLTDAIDELIKTINTYNYHYLKNNLSLFSSSNNHLVGELMGLVVISSYFEGAHINKDKWEKKFLRCLDQKFLNDGVDDELSTRYHMAVTDHFLNGLLFLKKSGSSISITTWNKFDKAFNIIEHLNYHGTSTRFGDSDDSFLIYPFFDDTFSLSNSLMDSKNYLNDQTRINEQPDFRNYLIFGKDYFDSNVVKEKELKSTFFTDAGYGFLYDLSAKLKVAFDVGPLGDQRLLAHAHSDQLSFTIQKNHFQFLVDPGTYQYHLDYSKWRHYFRGISAHNTISINNCNHATSLNRMSWGNPSEIVDVQVNLSEEVDEICGTTNAFVNQEILHKRKMELNKTNNTISINDHLEVMNNAKTKKALFFLHFHPEAIVKHDKNTLTIVSPSNDKIEIWNQYFSQAKLIKGDKEKPFGWFSESFDMMVASESLLLELEIIKSTRLTTRIRY